MELSAASLILALTVGAISLPSDTQAGQVLPAVIVASPNQGMEQGRLATCGLNIGIGTNGTTDSANITTVAMSAVFFSPDTTFGAISYRAETVSKSKTKPPVSSGEVLSAWLRLGGDNAIQMGPLLDNGNGVATGMVDLLEISRAMTQIADSSPRIQVGIRIKGMNADVIYTGVPILKAPEREVILGCISEMKERLKAFKK